MTNSVNVTYEGFVSMFPEFADQSTYPAATVNGFIVQAKCYITPNNVGMMVGETRELAIYLMVAHLLTLNSYILSGNTSGVLLTNSSIGDVSVSGTPPASKDMYEQWYGYTIYGVRLKALLDSFVGMGMYLQGHHEWGI